MPIHDWTRVDAGLFHHFHQSWVIEIGSALNHGGLPAGYFALAEQVVSGPVPDVVTLQTRQAPAEPADTGGGIAVAETPPRARFIRSVETDLYARKADRVVIQHRHGRVVAVIEIVSPGNKSTVYAVRSFVDKANQPLQNGIHLLVVDLFPPSPRDPQGFHQAIWDEIDDEPFEFPADKPLTVAAYCAGAVKTAYVDPVAVGDVLPELPIFLDDETYVPAPLEVTYQRAWENCPEVIRELIEPAD